MTAASQGLNGNMHKISQVMRSCRGLAWRLITLMALIAPVSQPTGAAAAIDNGLELWLPRHRIQANEIAVLVNDADPLSVRIATYYQTARGIPSGNLIHIRFRPGRREIPPDTFVAIRQQVMDRLEARIQALALTWALPYRVGCMSMTSAFTFGFDKAYCSARLCSATRHSGYYNSHSPAPYSDHGLRPAMAIAAQDFASAKQLIDRGVASDATKPRGTAYLLSTGDKNRNVRSVYYARIQQLLSGLLNIRIIHRDGIKNRRDILFYFTGITRVPHLDSLGFLPGAVADHLTSAGGVLDGKRQMNALRWLQAGATGSYGTVVEPCNLLGKFPNPGLVMDHYLYGQTLIEAYWKSVQQPGEGLFIGEPLAAPFDGYSLEATDRGVVLKTQVLRPGIYRLLVAPEAIGPYRTWPEPVIVARHQTRIRLPKTDLRYYRLQPAH